MDRLRNTANDVSTFEFKTCFLLCYDLSNISTGIILLALSIIPVIILVYYNTTYSTMYACLQLPILQYRAYYATIILLQYFSMMIVI